jgi:hypothetical protein
VAGKLASSACSFQAALHRRKVVKKKRGRDSLFAFMKTAQTLRRPGLRGLSPSHATEFDLVSARGNARKRVAADRQPLGTSPRVWLTTTELPLFPV